MNVTTRIEGLIQSYSPQHRWVQIGRTAIALAQLILVLGTSWANLNPYLSGIPADTTCSRSAQFSIFCITDADPAGFPRFFVVVVLVLVCAGIAPRILGFFHVWASFSLGASIGLPDGGEQVAQVATIAIAVLLVADLRAIAWKSPKKAPKRAALGVSMAGWWVLRAQMAGVYLQSGIAKFGVEDWLNGTAMYYVVRDPSFGAVGPVGALMRHITDTALGTAVLSWGTIVLECAIAVGILLNGRARRYALIGSCALHVGIILTIGLWTFALIMIGAMFVACAPLDGGGYPLKPRSSSRVRADEVIGVGDDIEYTKASVQSRERAAL